MTRAQSLRSATRSPLGLCDAAAKSADPDPTPRPKPQVAATFQSLRPTRRSFRRPKASLTPGWNGRTKQAAQASAEPKPQTLADIINSRGFWDDVPKAANEATPAQVASLRARQVLAATTDPQPTPSVTETFNKAMAYTPAAASQVDRANVVTATAPIRRVPPSGAQCRRRGDRNQYRGRQGRAGSGQRGRDLDPSRRRPGQQHMDARRNAGAEREQRDVDDRVGDTEMTQMRRYFVKPQAAIAMTFSEDPLMGMTCDRFTGSATAQLPTQSFVVRTAALR